MTSKTRFRVSALTTPGKTTYSMALSTIVRLDFVAGSRYRRVPKNTKFSFPEFPIQSYKTYEIRICIHKLIQSLKLTKYLKHHRHNLHGDVAERIRATIRDLQLSFLKIRISEKSSHLSKTILKFSHSPILVAKFIVQFFWVVHQEIPPRSSLLGGEVNVLGSSLRTPESGRSPRGLLQSP